MSQAGLNILMVAVRMAKNEQISRAAVLRRRLLSEFPGKDREVDEALAAWADYERRKDQRLS